MKVVFCGDSHIGKTSYLIRYATGQFPTGYIPIAYDNQAHFHFVQPNGETQEVYLDIWDIIPIEEEPISMRCNRYVGADLICLCFSVQNVESLQHVVSFWKDELDEHCFNIPIMLIGLCDDENGSSSEQSLGNTPPCVDFDPELNQAQRMEALSQKLSQLQSPNDISDELVRQITQECFGHCPYVKTSSKLGTHINDVWQQGIQWVSDFVPQSYFPDWCSIL